MERLLSSLGMVVRENGIGYGYRVDIFFVENPGCLQRFIPENLRRGYIGTRGGGLALADARRLLEEVQQEELPGFDHQRGGVYTARIVVEDPFQ